MSSVNPLASEDLALVPRPPAALRRVRLLVAGHTGRVGSRLVQLIAAQRARLATQSHLELHVSCQVNRSQCLWHDAEAPWRKEIALRQEGDWPTVLRRFAAAPGPKLLVDCTASAEVAALYLECFGAGLGVVTANKIANSGSSAQHRELQRAALRSQVAYRYETTAGAALPLLAPLADLRASGDELTRVEAVLSGTLSFVFQRMHQGLAFSAAVREARDLGYSEPHPAEDLKALDSARKLVILLREAGVTLEPEQVRVQGLSPPALEGETDPERYLAALAAYDAQWAERLEACRRQGTRLACLAQYDGREASIGVTPISAADAFGHLGPGETLVRAWTRRYQAVPLSIAGPGAGTEVTAGGLLTDILKAATLSQRN